MRNIAQKAPRTGASKLSFRRPSQAARSARSEYAVRGILPALRQMLKSVAACFQDPCDMMEAGEDEAVHPFKRQAIAWLAYGGRRLRASSDSTRGGLIALTAVLIAAGLTGGMRALLQVDSSLFFLGAVVISAGLGGLRAGMAATLYALFPCAWYLYNPVYAASVPGHPLASLLLFAFMAIVTCALSDSLFLARQQAEAARAQAEHMARRARFLAEASALLDAAPDYAALLGQVTRASVPAFADWAAVDMLNANNLLDRVAATHRDAEKEALLRSLRQRFPVDLQENHPIANVLRAGQGELVSDVTESLLQTISEHTIIEPEDQEAYIAVGRMLAPRSFLCVPLSARGRVLGVLTLALTSPERRYTATDMAVARDLALRVGLALDNLRLYQEAQDEIAKRILMEQRVREINADLKRQQWELKEANGRLAEQVNTDGLTGLYNHRAFQEALQNERERTLRYRAPLSVLLLDVDRFKQYNDTYGHPAGDQVLRQVARVLGQSARATDFVARYGGEEFVVILPDTDEAGTMLMGERLRQAVEAMTGLERAVTASFGAATLTSGATTTSELIACADKALYASKRDGRNRVTHARSLLMLTQAVTAVSETPSARTETTF